MSASGERLRPVERRVLVLNHFALPPGEAGGTRHVELFGRLRGWRPTIIAANRLTHHGTRTNPHPMFREVWVLPSEGNGARRIAGWLSYFATATVTGARGARPALVYGSSPHLLAPLAAWAVAKRFRVPFVLEIRDLWPKVLLDMGTLAATSPVYRALEWLETFLYRRADLVVAMAEGTITELQRRGDVRAPIIFVPNGADPADFAVSEPRAELRAEHGFERFTIVYAGAHGPANGLEFVLDAAEALQGVQAAVDFVLVGDGADKDRLRREATRRGLHSVRFLDPVPKSAMPRLLAAADAGLHCLADVELFRYGVSPNKLFDYMAAGLPVITNTPGEVTALVQDAGAGFTCEPGGIAAAVRELLACTDGERAALGEAGKAHLEARRSRSAMAERLEVAFEQLLSPASTPGRPAERRSAVGGARASSR